LADYLEKKIFITILIFHQKKINFFVFKVFTKWRFWAGVGRAGQRESLGFFETLFKNVFFYHFLSRVVL